MKLFMLILVIFLLLKNINVIEGLFLPPSSIGRGKLCPLSATLEQELPPCMNGFLCDNDSYETYDDIGRCRINNFKEFF